MELINSTIAVVMSALDTLLKMPTVLLFVFALNIVGWALKLVPQFNNRLIPWVLLGLSAIGMFFLLPRTPTGLVDATVRYPEVVDAARCVSVGLVIGFSSWLFHKLVLARAEAWIERKVGKWFPPEEDPNSKPQDPSSK